MAIGATRARLVRQLLTESLVLSLVGTALGLVFARWASTLVAHALSSRTSRVSLDLSLDWRVLAFTTAIGLVTALLFGAAPALRSTHCQTGLAQGHMRVPPGGRRYTLEKLLAAVQVALSLVLLFGAGLFLRSFAALLTVDTGFGRRNVLVVSLDLRRTQAGPPARRAALFEQVLDSVRSTPGVASAAFTLFAPLSGAWSSGPVDVPGTGALRPHDRQTYFNEISDDYFHTLGVPLLAGRDFTRGDALGASRVAIVNQAFARKFFGESNPVGRSYEQEGVGTTQIVGFVADTKYRNLREPPPPTVFRPERQRAAPEPWLHLVIRGRDPALLTTSVGPAVTRVNERIKLDPRPLDRDADDSLIQERLVATLSGFFGALALLVASIGLYGLVSLAVTRRQREIGVRLALGALPRTVLCMVLRDVWTVTAVGLLAGSLASLVVARFASSLVFGLEPTDVATLTLAISTLVVSATLAGYLPARRAARLDPMTALRDE